MVVEDQPKHTTVGGVARAGLLGRASGGSLLGRHFEKGGVLFEMKSKSVDEKYWTREMIQMI